MRVLPRGEAIPKMCIRDSRYTEISTMEACMRQLELGLEVGHVSLPGEGWEKGMGDIM